MPRSLGFLEILPRRFCRKHAVSSPQAGRESRMKEFHFPRRRRGDGRYGRKEDGTEAARQRGLLGRIPTLESHEQRAWDAGRQEFVYRSPEVYRLFGLDPNKDIGA